MVFFRGRQGYKFPGGIGGREVWFLLFLILSGFVEFVGLFFPAPPKKRGGGGAGGGHFFNFFFFQKGFAGGPGGGGPCAGAAGGGGLLPPQSGRGGGAEIEVVELHGGVVALGGWGGPRGGHEGAVMGDGHYHSKEHKKTWLF